MHEVHISLVTQYIERTVFHVKTDVDLMQDNSQVVRLRIADHHKLQIGWGFIVVKLIVSCSVRNKTYPNTINIPFLES